MQVDEQNVFRHRGERKVKTVEEDMDEVTASAAELLEDGEELIGRRRGLVGVNKHKAPSVLHCHVNLYAPGKCAFPLGSIKCLPVIYLYLVKRNRHRCPQHDGCPQQTPEVVSVVCLL